MLPEKLGTVLEKNKTNGWLYRQNCSLSEVLNFWWNPSLRKKADLLDMAFDIQYPPAVYEECNYFLELFVFLCLLSRYPGIQANLYHVHILN